ncbi:hypothetical protein [Sphingobacterium sp. SYP-B4668]|uniref:hypothetical protein n=1 Tax=Sphingobacterium sp. SYP-B4668 TaxID=2996035 RepID=UPI0022DE0E90|nr:hypothetical protein [Sphingobacterium sp. SYP-B4668]
MNSKNAKQILSDLYGLMMEINYHRSDQEVLNELQESHDPTLDKYLIQIKQMKARLRALENESRFQKAIEYFKSLKGKGIDEIKKSLSLEDQTTLIPLFRKFENLTQEDEKDILEDSDLLYYIEILKEKLDSDEDT